MNRIKSPLGDALHAVRRNWITSLVYCVLNAAIEDYPDRDIRSECQGFGAYVAAKMLLEAAQGGSPGESDCEHPWILVSPWEAELLRSLTPDEIVLAVEYWTYQVPLDPRVNPVHAVEYAQYRRLRELRQKLNQ